MPVEPSDLPSENSEARGVLARGGGEGGDMAPATAATAGSEAASSDQRVPLKTILQNFLNHVESLESRKRGGDDAYEKEFQVSRDYMFAL